MSDRKESTVGELIGAAALCGVLLLVLSPLLWGFGALGLLWRAAAGYGALYLAALATALFTTLLLRALGLHPDSGRGYDVRLFGGLAVSVLLMAAFAALVALSVAGAAAAAPGWAAALFYAGGLLACYGGFVMITAVYLGGAYRVAALAVCVVAYLLFAIAPPAARLLFGWLARLVGLPA